VFFIKIAFRSARGSAYIKFFCRIDHPVKDIDFFLHK